jgi:hypothetical protein
MIQSVVVTDLVGGGGATYTETPKRLSVMVGIIKIGIM